MITRLLILSLLLATGSRAAAAQVPAGMPTAEDMKGMMAMAQEMMNPAAMVLSHRTELGLTADQVRALDSISAPLNAFLEETMRRGPAPAMQGLAAAMSNPSIAIDEEAVRAAFRAQADQQADLMIRSIKVARAVDVILTPAQRETRTKLQMNSMLDMMRGMGGAATGGTP